MTLVQFLLIAFLVEALVQAAKPLYEKRVPDTDVIIAFVLGIALALLTGLDLFVIVDMPLKLPYVGSVLSGVLLSRGANFAHDVVKYIEGLKVGKTSGINL